MSIDVLPSRSGNNLFIEEPALSTHNPLVLLVDDDDDVRETSADMLEELGYHVMQASNGYEALRQLEEHRGLEVMVSDIRMPGMSGVQLSQVAAERFHGLRIILMSGYFNPEPITCRFLQKPFRTVDLDRAIRAELACLGGRSVAGSAQLLGERWQGRTPPG